VKKKMGADTMPALLEGWWPMPGKEVRKICNRERPPLVPRVSEAKKQPPQSAKRMPPGFISYLDPVEVERPPSGESWRMRSSGMATARRPIS
jgi:hypothetical protein